MSQGAAVKQSTSGEVEERNYVDGKLNGKVKILPQIKGQMWLKTQVNTMTNMVRNTNMMASIADSCYKEKEDQYILCQATVIYSDSSKEQRTYKVSKLLFFPAGFAPRYFSPQITTELILMTLLILMIILIILMRMF